LVRRPLFGLLYQSRMIPDDKFGAVCGMRLSGEPAPVPLCPPHDLTWDQTRAAATNRLSYGTANQVAVLRWADPSSKESYQLSVRFTVLRLVLNGYRPDDHIGQKLGSFTDDNEICPAHTSVHAEIIAPRTRHFMPLRKWASRRVHYDLGRLRFGTHFFNTVTSTAL
jgi:hypothetical protein